jgi:hypothetical protein
LKRYNYEHESAQQFISYAFFCCAVVSLRRQRQAAAADRVRVQPVPRIGQAAEQTASREDIAIELVAATARRQRAAGRFRSKKCLL